MYYNRLNRLFNFIYPELEWRIQTPHKEIFLTFDDGPVSGPTDFVLETLKTYSAKATFFCVGNNVVQNPALFKKLLEAGHRAGNHTFNHLNGWQTDNTVYLENIKKAEQTMQGAGLSKSIRPLLRPPYGKINKSQIKLLRKEYRIIMWDVLTGDYNQGLPKENCLKKALKFSRPGSIVIFHDSYKAEKNMQFALPRFLEHYLEKGFVFKTL